jgi:hypothetical protein
MTPRSLEMISAVLLVAVLGVALAVQVRAFPAVPLVVALVITVSAGLDLVLRGEARYRPTPDLFILPAALVVGAVLFLPLLASGTSIVAGLAVFGALLFAVFWAEHSIRLGLVPPRTGETALAIVGYAAAFVLYAAIYQAKTRSLISGPAIVLVTFLLAARQLRLAHDPPTPAEPAQPATTAGTAELSGPSGIRPSTRPNGAAPTSAGAAAFPPGAAAAGRLADPTLLASAHARRQAALPAWPKTLLYAAAVSLAVGEITWALNYWPLNGLLGGAFLLAAFYLLVGVLSHHLQNRLTRRLVAEYGAVASVGAALVAAAGLLRRAA